MRIVRRKLKKEPINQLNLRMPLTLQDRIDSVYSECLAVQPDIKKAELLRDAIERGLTEIENQLFEATKTGFGSKI
jgi:hypothetical protein